MSHWSTRSLCTGLHSDMFFPPLFKEDRDVPESQYYSLGKYVCEQCPVIDQCGDAGANEEYGMWGGRTPKERALGTRTFNKTYLPIESVHAMPRDAPDTAIKVSEVKAEIRPYLKRRSKSITGQ